jgi:hypothetical protein
MREIQELTIQAISEATKTTDRVLSRRGYFGDFSSGWVRSKHVTPEPLWEPRFNFLQCRLPLST